MRPLAFAFAVSLLAAGCGTDGLTPDTPDLALPPDLAAPLDLARGPDLVVKPSGIGDPCTGTGGFSQGSCNDGQICIPDPQFGFVDGYCTQQCSPQNPCPDDASCIAVGGMFRGCFKKCVKDTDCREPDYGCSAMGKVCSPLGDGQSVPVGTRDGGACVTPIVNPGQGLKGPFGKNLQVAGSPQTVEAECHLAVDPKSQNLVVGYIPINRQGSFIAGVHSKDLGNTFAPPVLLPVDQTVNMNQAQSDPVLAVDPMGTFWMVWVGYDGGGGGRPTNMRIWAASSKSGGAMWEGIVEVSPPGEGNGFTLDKPWIGVSPVDGALYVSWNKSSQQAVDIRLARSADHGKTWTTQRISDTASRPGNARNLAQIAVNADGKVGVAWVELLQEQFGSIQNGIYLQRLNADGTLNGRNVKVSRGSDSPAFDDPSIAMFGNTVYVGFVSGTPRGVWDIRAAASIDGGATFQPSVKVNDDPSCATHFHHQLAVDAKGNLHAVWFDNRFLVGNLFYANSGPADAMNTLKFGPNLFVNDTSFTFTTRRDMSNWVGDYLGFTILGGDLYAAWTDNRRTNNSHIFFAKGKSPR